MFTGQWDTPEEFEEWWKDHSREHNRLAVTDPEEWERVAKKIEAFQAKRYAKERVQ